MMNKADLVFVLLEPAFQYRERKGGFFEGWFRKNDCKVISVIKEYNVVGAY